jgi:hypothetical protein
MCSKAGGSLLCGGLPQFLQQHLPGQVRELGQAQSGYPVHLLQPLFSGPVVVDRTLLLRAGRGARLVWQSHQGAWGFWWLPLLIIEFKYLI